MSIIQVVFYRHKILDLSLKMLVYCHLFQLNYSHCIHLLYLYTYIYTIINIKIISKIMIIFDKIYWDF